MPQLKKEDYVVALAVLLISVLGISQFYVLHDSVQATHYRQNLLNHVDSRVQESVKLEKFFNSLLYVCQTTGGNFVIGGKSANFTDEAWREYQSTYVERAKANLLTSSRACEQDSIFVKRGTLREVRGNKLSFAGQGELALTGFFLLKLEFTLRSESPEDMIISSWSFREVAPKKGK
jgi:hypothetical protein